MNHIRHGMAEMLNIIFGTIVFFISLRFILRVLSANQSALFVAWVYSVSNFFITPFRGIFKELYMNDYLIDVDAIVSLIGYTIIFYFVVAVLGAIVSIFKHDFRKNTPVQPTNLA